jgi:transposase
LISDELLKVDKSALVKLILQQDEQLKALRAENQSLHDTVEKLKAQLFPPKRKSKDKTGRVIRSKPPHQWGRKKGHVGSWRPVPEQIDKEIDLRLTTCPNCRNPLGESKHYDEHVQEEIIPARVEVTRYRHWEYWCGTCQAHVVAPYAIEEIPYGHLGPRALSVMALLKYHYVLPGNKIKAILFELSGLKVSEGGIAQALQRLGQYLGAEAEAILGWIRQAAYKHADETGWKINGKNHWLWAFVNEMWGYYLIHKSRGSQVPKAILGNPVQGTLVSDFHSAYGKLQGKKQKCLVHLKREMKSCLGKDPPPEYRGPYRKLRRILSDAVSLDERRGKLSRLDFQRKARALKKRLLDFACGTYTDKNWKRLSKRLIRHADEMFTFLDQPGLPKDNNPAERSIRPHVILRNRSFQNRTRQGADAHGTLTSIIYSLMLQKKSALQEIQKAYPLHRQRSLVEQDGNGQRRSLTPIIFAPPPMASDSSRNY